MTLPVPYPADTRAKGWRFELDYERVRQSDTWALTPAEYRPWLLMLWMVAWEQTPCGSIPEDDGLICARIGMTPKSFTKAKAALLRGWWLAEDGRLYHKVITERVLEMLEWRRKEAERKRGNRGKTPEPTKNPAPVPRDTTVTDDTGTGTSNSLPDGKDGDAVLTKQELWNSGKSLLAEQGMAKAQCGTFVGKLVKDYGDEVVIDAVRSCVVKRPADAAQYLVATCKHLAGQRQKPDIAKTTVPGRQGPDPELLKAENDDKNRAPMPDSVREFKSRLKGSAV